MHISRPFFYKKCRFLEVILWRFADFRRLAQTFCRLYHIFDSGFGFVPSAGFEATVGIYPKAFGGNIVLGFNQQIYNFFHTGNAGRMNIVDAGTYLVGVTETAENVQEFHLRTRTFNGDYVGVHKSDVLNDVVELGIAHMGVNLSLVFYARR